MILCQFDHVVGGGRGREVALRPPYAVLEAAWKGKERKPQMRLCNGFRSSLCQSESEREMGQ